MVTLEQTVIRRLAFIKYLFKTAINQSRSQYPLNSVSILMMHAAVELFFQLAGEHLNAGSKIQHFMDYFESLNSKLDPKELQQRAAMGRLNKARNALKHNGSFPSQLDVDSYRATTASFFDSNTPLVFGINLDEVSLADFVNPESARQKLKEAQKDIQDGLVADAIDKTALAFAEMIDDYELRNRDHFHDSPFWFSSDLFFFGPIHRNSMDGFPCPCECRLEDFADRVRYAVRGIDEALKVIALGIDYKKYSTFKNLTPSVTRTLGAYQIHWRADQQSDRSSVLESQFCIDFVVECAMALAEFDYTFASRDE
ncbi:MAG: hypothetical protein AB1473_05870 [Thermodesulfobacteriota bacterium]